MFLMFSSYYVYVKQLYCFSGFILVGLMQLVSSSLCHETDFPVLMVWVFFI